MTLGRLKRLSPIWRGGIRRAFEENQVPADEGGWDDRKKGLLVGNLERRGALSGGLSVGRALKI